MKNMVAMAISIMLFLKIKQVPLKRDLLLIALADEEEGGNFGLLFVQKYLFIYWFIYYIRILYVGAKWLLNNFPAEVECDVMLGEGGGMNFIAGTQMIGVALGEKGVTNYKLVATGPGGHASLPTLDNPIYTISRAAQELTTGQMRFRSSALVQEFFAGN